MYYDDDDYYYRLLRDRRRYWYDRDHDYWNWPYYHYPIYGGYYGGQYSSVDQGIYNSGYMSNSGQSSIINQTNK